MTIASEMRDRYGELVALGEDLYVANLGSRGVFCRQSEAGTVTIGGLLSLLQPLADPDFDAIVRDLAQLGLAVEHRQMPDGLDYCAFEFTVNAISAEACARAFDTIDEGFARASRVVHVQQ